MATSPTIHQTMKATPSTAIELPKQYQEHVDPYFWKRDEDNELPTHNDGIAKARFVKGGAVKVDFVDGEVLYFYKGREFYESSDTGKGCYGRWRLGDGTRGCWTDSLANIIAYIDAKEAERAERAVKAHNFDQAAFDHIMASSADPEFLAKNYGLTRTLVNQIQMGKVTFEAAKTAALATL